MDSIPSHRERAAEHHWPNSLLLGVMAAIILFLTIQPLFQVGYTTADDVESLMVLANLGDLLTFARSDGRLCYFLSCSIGYVRTIVDSFAYLKAMQLLPIIALIFYATYLVRRLFQSRAVALVFFVLICLAQQNFWQHNILTAHPLTIHTAVLAFFASIHLFVHGIRTDSMKTLVCSAGCFSFSLLMYEMFLPFIVVFGVIALYFKCVADTNRFTFASLKQTLRVMLPHILLFTLVCTAYVALRMTVSVLYGGVRVVDHFSLGAFFNTLWALSTSAAPPGYFFEATHAFQNFRESYEPYHGTAAYLLANYRPEWLVRCAVACTLFLYGFFAITPRRIPLKTLIFLMTIVTLLVFLPNLLLAMTPSKQEWVTSGGARTYTGTYISAYPLMLLYLGFVYGIRLLVDKYPRSVQILAGTILALVIGVMSYLTDFSNYYVSKIQGKDFMLWKTVLEFVQSEPFKNIPEHATIYAPSLFPAGRFWGLFHRAPAMNDYWERFILKKTGRSMKVLRNWDASICREGVAPPKDHAVYYVRYMEEQLDTNYAILSAAIETNTPGSCAAGALRSHSMDLLMLTRHENYVLLAQMEPGPQHEEISLNGSPKVASHSDLLLLEAENPARTADNRAAMLRVGTTQRAILLDSLNIHYGHMDLGRFAHETYSARK